MLIDFFPLVDVLKALNGIGFWIDWFAVLPLSKIEVT
jgi:hypothetical protein